MIKGLSTLADLLRLIHESQVQSKLSGSKTLPQKSSISIKQSNGIPLLQNTCCLKQGQAISLTLDHQVKNNNILCVCESAYVTSFVK